MEKICKEIAETVVSGYHKFYTATLLGSYGTGGICDI